MANPFEKRATEFLRDKAAFLSVVTPEPLHTFFESFAADETLYDRLCLVIGTPGSGKTTIATLLQYDTVHALLSNTNHSDYKTLQSALAKCRIIKNNKIKILGCRIPLESEYRQFWELPYNNDLKFGLLKSFLQARALLIWLNGLEKSGKFNLDEVEILYRSETEYGKQSVGGTVATDVYKKAQKIEALIYGISAALVPPNENNLPEEIKVAYHPFDFITGVLINKGNPKTENVLQPLVMLDDFHTLHPEQMTLILDWLAKREMKISRWLLTRLDGQSSETVLFEGAKGKAIDQPESLLKPSREITTIWLQNSEESRAKNRRDFRSMAQSMADKYLGLMSIFRREGIKQFQNILNTVPYQISSSDLKKLSDKVRNFQRKMNIPDTIREGLEKEIERYISGDTEFVQEDDVRMEMLSILLHRYVNRVPIGSLFEVKELIEPKKKISADATVADGARIHLLHDFNRPYYFGIKTVCDASAENAEQFLQLAGTLVSASETQLIRKTDSVLSAQYQHRLLVEKSEKVVREWSFPRSAQVRKLCEYIAGLCVKKSMEPNASLGGGANAIGIPEEEFETLHKDHQELAQILKFGVAYNALLIKRYHKTKHQFWALLELSGPFLIVSRLTLSRGGFIEKNLQDVLKVMEK